MKKSYQSKKAKSTYSKMFKNASIFSIINITLSLFIFLLNFTISFGQEADSSKGKTLFNTNCAACHALDRKMTGPALRNVQSRLEENEGLDIDWLRAWIRNSAAVIKSGDAYANKIYNEYNKSAMTAFPQLSDQDIADILAYTALPKEEPGGGGGEVVTAQVVAVEQGISNEIILGALALLFVLLAAGLFMVNQTLRKFADAKDIPLPEKEKTTPLWQAFVQNQFLMLVTSIFFLLASGYFAYGYLMQVGVDQGYEPVQPIHFSHKIHAGDNKIDCKYCHSSARKSKHSGIPSVNVCMNCHKSIYEYNGETTVEYDKAFYDAEIKKIYAAAGWDEENQQYTGDTKPIKWVRIHNLPDFAYFNHSQHVEVGGIECQTCHGPVEEMEIMYQYSPLTMGWCINCHRETNVKVKDNAYYEKIHEELSKKYGVEQLTVAQMGGLECGKCHY